MKSIWTVCASVCLAGLIAAVVTYAIDMVGQTVTGFRVPDYDEENNLKTLLFGDFAKVLRDGVIEITGLRIEFYQAGKVSMTVTAPHCHLNQKAGVAESEGEVRIANEDMVVTGRGFEWIHAEEVFKIRSDARVVLRNARAAVETGETP